MREWTEKDETVLADAEKFFKMAKLVFGTVDLWTDDVGANIDPDELPDDLKARVTHVMWKVSMLQLIVDTDHPGKAFEKVVQWGAEMNPGGIMVKEINSPEERDAYLQAIGEQTSNGKEEKRGGYL